MNDSRKVIISWSGGKDSCIALYKAVKSGYDVSCLLNFISKEFKRGCFHGLDSGILKAQAECIGIPLVQKEVSPDMKNYEEEFKQAVLELKKTGIEAMVFGDIYLDEHKEWVERVCRELEILPIEPLWGMSPERLVNEFIEAGFKALVVSAKSDLFDEDWIGREINKKFLEEIKRKNICPCGENGEFHTFVYNGPVFKKRIEITESSKLHKDGFWKHWFLDIKQYKTVKKGDLSA